MAIEISGVNNNDKITASDGVIDTFSGVSFASTISAPSFTGNLTGDVTGNLTGNVNQTSNLLLQIGGSEKIRISSSGQIGIGGANYGTAGQVLTSGGSGGAVSWSTINSDAISEGDTKAEVVDTGSDGHFKVITENTERLRIASNGAIGLSGANYGTAGQVLTSQGSGSAPQWATPSGVLQTVYQIKGAFETEATNSNASSTPEAIIDGCQAQIQVTNANSKIMVTYAGFNFYSKRYGPALAYIDIGFADSSSSGVNFSVSDYSTLGTDGSGSHRKPKSPTSSDWYRGEAGPGCVRVLHTHGKPVGKYIYYTLMARQTYSSSNSPGYIFNGGSGYFTVTLQEII